MSNCFVAIVPDGVKENPELKSLIGKMKRTLSDRRVEARWSHPDLWHVTIAFLGPLIAEERAKLLQLVSTWRPTTTELEIRLHGLGGFPEPEQARVLWLGVQENQQFLNLQSELADLLLNEGFTLGTREFHPHMTLARLRNPHSVTDLMQLAGRKNFGNYTVREFIVFQTALQGNILKYVPLARVPLLDRT